MRLKGGPELRARLANVIANAPEYERAWADDAKRRIKPNTPRRTGAGQASITSGMTRDGTKGGVYGNYYLGILDRGTKAYTIRPKSVTGGGRGGRGTASILKFEYRGRTVFAKKSDRRKLRRRPFISKGAQEALAASPIRDAIVKAWSRKSSRAGFRTVTV